MTDRIEGLLERWEESARGGEELSPDELSPDDPELACQLAYHIGVLRRMGELAAGLGEPARGVPMWGAPRRGG